MMIEKGVLNTTPTAEEKSVVLEVSEQAWIEDGKHPHQKDYRWPWYAEWCQWSYKEGGSPRRQEKEIQVGGSSQAMDYP
jgi:hypothetical protein